MRFRMRKGIMVALVLSTSLQASQAIVTGYGMDYYADYLQDSDSQPVNDPNCFLQASVSADTNGDLGAVQATAPNGAILNFFDDSNNAGTSFLAGYGYFSSTA